MDVTNGGKIRYTAGIRYMHAEAGACGANPRGGVRMLRNAVVGGALMIALPAIAAAQNPSAVKVGGVVYAQYQYLL